MQIFEKTIHENIWKLMGQYCKRYFCRPVTFLSYEYSYLGIPKDSYIMMAAPGMTLDQWMETPQAKDQKKVRKVVRGIRKALYCLWTTGFIHGDMHLRNVMVNPKNQGIKIIDFGMSRGVNKRSPKYRGPSNLGELRPVFKEWFWHQFKKVLKTHGFNKGNPDLVMFENACKENNVFCKVTTDALKTLR